ncbi:MAG: class I SAM-dependent RNA methyltransferase [Candidatus Eisenbacteria bacterium]|nr:class I SAM-dependent RNA methyltransferase [Candidatus Eisenbacteria bacterium]
MDEAPVIETTIEKLATGGAGLARVGGEVFFVRGALPGERVLTRIVRRARGVVEAEATEILDPSPDRVEPPPGPPGALAGADLAHMRLDAQRAAKTEILRDCLSRIGRIVPADFVEPPEPVGPPWGYRNKIRLHGDGAGLYGMHFPGTRRLIPLERNHLLPDLFHEEALPLLRRLPPAEEATIRFDGRGGFLLSLGSRGRGADRLAARTPTALRREPPPASCAGVLAAGRRAHGKKHLEIRIAGKRFRVHAGSFFQVNLAETEGLLSLVVAALDEAGASPGTPAPLLLDLYGGVGLFSLALADRFERILLVESGGSEIRDAGPNVRRDPDAAGRVEVIHGAVEEIVAGWSARGFPRGDSREAIALVDPPREGLAPAALDALVSLAPRRILYVGCDPATLSRDAGRLVREGYEPLRARVIDMFPQTSHLETLLVLAR